MTSPDPKPALRPGLYLGDNGRCFCADSVRCAGGSAYFTGHDLSGQKVEWLTRKMVLEAGYDPGSFHCETCGKGLEDFE